MKKVLEIDDLKILAKKKLPKMFYDYVDSGSYTESTYIENVRPTSLDTYYFFLSSNALP